jgi:hypothetical protein
MAPDQLEREPTGTARRTRSRSRAELLHVLVLPDFERADRIGSY